MQLLHRAEKNMQIMHRERKDKENWKIVVKYFAIYG